MLIYLSARPRRIGEAFYSQVANLLLVQREVDSYCYGYGSTHHWVVTHAEEAHHLNVSRNRRRTCELSV